MILAAVFLIVTSVVALVVLSMVVPFGGAGVLLLSLFAIVAIVSAGANR